MKIEIELTVYEENGTETVVERPDFRVKSHWNRDNMVVVCVGGHSYTLCGKDLREALERATGWKW